MAHEIGHLLGLPHDAKACSVMNPRLTRIAGKARPSMCGSGDGALVQPADVRAARALAQQPLNAAAPCDPAGGELPLFAQDFACKYAVRCAGARGRNLFDEPATVVIDAEIAARCHRVLRVDSLGDDAAPDHPVTTTGAFAGTTSQGKRISFAVRRGVVQRLTSGVHFRCTDNTSQFGNSILSATPSAQEAQLLSSLGLKVVNQRVNGDESIGPFPAVSMTNNSFRASLEAPNASALYDLRGSLHEGTWTGSLHIVEGWHTSALGLIPDPDGEVVCDTGEVTFTARRS
jgi:hypothetical protein